MQLVFLTESDLVNCRSRCSQFMQSVFFMTFSEAMQDNRCSSVTAVSVPEKQKKLPPVYLFAAIGNELVKTEEVLTAGVNHPVFNPKQHQFIAIVRIYHCNSSLWYQFISRGIFQFAKFLVLLLTLQITDYSICTNVCPPYWLFFTAQDKYLQLWCTCCLPHDIAEMSCTDSLPAICATAGGIWDHFYVATKTLLSQSSN